MPAHEKAFARINVQILAARGRGDDAKVDQLLEEWYDLQERATEWDVDQWGLADIAREVEKAPWTRAERYAKRINT